MKNVNQFPRPKMEIWKIAQQIVIMVKIVMVKTKNKLIDSLKSIRIIDSVSERQIR